MVHEGGRTRRLFCGQNNERQLIRVRSLHVIQCPHTPDFLSSPPPGFLTEPSPGHEEPHEEPIVAFVRRRRSCNSNNRPHHRKRHASLNDTRATITASKRAIERTKDTLATSLTCGRMQIFATLARGPAMASARTHCPFCGECPRETLGHPVARGRGLFPLLGLQAAVERGKGHGRPSRPSAETAA